MWSAVRRADLRGRISCERRRGVLWDNKVFRHARARGQWAREHLYSSALCSRHIRSAFRDSGTRLWTDGRRVSAGGEGQQRGAAARSAGADRGGAAAAAASRASLRACPCLDDVERDQKIHLLPASTPTSPWHHNRCQHFSNFLPYALGISSCIQTCTALLRGRFSPCFEALCADVGLSPARHSVQMVFLSHAWDRARSTDTLLSTQRAWVSTFTCTLMIASCAVTEMQ